MYILQILVIAARRAVRYQISEIVSCGPVYIRTIIENMKINLKLN